MIILLYISFASQLEAQDPHFSQFYAAPLYLAPSFAGSSGEFSRMGLNYRNQWPEIKNAFSTYSASFDHYFQKINSGAGIFFMQDRAGYGSLTRTSLGVVYSFDFKIFDNHHVRPGVHFKYLQNALNFNKLEFYDQLITDQGTSTYISPTNNSKGDVDFAVSALAYGEIYWAGISWDHVLKPNQSLTGGYSPVPMKFSFFGGFKYILRERLLKEKEESVTFAFLYKQQDLFKQLDIGAYYHNNPLVFGVWYRGIPFFKSYPGSDAIIFLVGYKINNLNIGYSFDISVSNLRGYSGGAHEVSFIYNFKIKQWKRKPTAIPCPHF